MSNLPCIICNVMQEVTDAEGLMAVKCATCSNTQSEATIRERERIIKLLEDQWLPIADVDKCIALIKGENK